MGHFETENRQYTGVMDLSRLINIKNLERYSGATKLRYCEEIADVHHCNCVHQCGVLLNGCNYGLLYPSQTSQVVWSK